MSTQNILTEPEYFSGAPVAPDEEAIDAALSADVTAVYSIMLNSIYSDEVSKTDDTVNDPMTPPYNED